MSNVSSLMGRIDAEFSALESKIKKAQVQHVEALKDRERKLQQLTKVFERLGEIWKPRLDLLVKKFGDRVQVSPRIVPSTREATFEFQSKLARIRLKFAATTDRDITKVVLSYDLDIVPVMMRYDAHSEFEFPLDAVDTDAVAKWMDDRIVSFVKTYLSLHENDYYLKDEMVEDPIAGVRFPKYAAGATIEHDGQKYYFVDEETRREFEKKKGITVK